MLHLISVDRNKPKRAKNGKEPSALTEEIVMFNEEVDKQGNSYSEVTLVCLIK
jgi:hypothetical protein